MTLDFGGHFISGPQVSTSGLYGVYANERSNLTTKNGTIAYMIYTPASTITNCKVSQIIGAYGINTAGVSILV